MAARRLLALLIVLLIISSLAAALAPERDAETTTESSTSSSTTTRADTDQAADGAVLSERIPADPGEPVRIDAEPGDQLALTVAVAGPSKVSIPDLGLTGFATATDPARFDLLLRRQGRFAVNVAAQRTPVGLIVVGATGEAAEDR